jgi:hypothetical protein
MWAKVVFSGELEYQSPSVMHLNPTPFKWRYFSQVHGPFPVIMRGRYAGFEKKQWFDNKKLLSNPRQFEVYYGYNPRCCHKGTWKKPGFGFWQTYAAAYNCKNGY